MSEDVFKVYQSLAEALGKSTGSTIAEWLQDSMPAAISMTDSVMTIRRSVSVGMSRVDSLVDASELLASDVVSRARKAGPGGGELIPRSTQTHGSGTLTPPSSNTGGKVGHKPKTPKGSS